MKLPFTTPRQISQLIVDLMSEIESSSDVDTTASSWLDIALGFLAQKQIQYEGDGYVDEVERNAVYHREAATMFMATMAEFLCGGTPSLKKQDIDSFLIDLRQDALDATGWQLDFIRSDCDGCLVHDWHHFWSNWRRMRREDPIADYRLEVEFGCIYHQMIFSVSERCLENLLPSRNYAGRARLLRGKKVFQTIDEEIRRQVRLGSGLGRAVPEDASRWTWRYTWGQRFDQIKTAM